MTTKEWLSRATNIDREIGRLLRERRAAWDRAVSITSRLNSTCVSGTKDPHKYDAVVEYEEMIDARIDELYTTKQEIQSTICRIQDATLRELLDRRYIRGQRFEEIACVLRKPKDGQKYTYRHVVMELHPKALKEVENILSEYHKIS